MHEIEMFKNNLIAANIADPEGVHSEFVGDGHGQKIDFDRIATDSTLFDEWRNVTANVIKRQYPLHRYLNGIVLLSVAGGTNRFVGPLAEAIGTGYTPALTQKISSKEVSLTEDAKELFATAKPDLIIPIEDVGTTGKTSSTAVIAVRRFFDSDRTPEIKVLNTWQRTIALPRLEEIDVSYSSIIYEPLPTYSPEQCRTAGYCALNWKLIPHD